MKKNSFIEIVLLIVFSLASVFLTGCSSATMTNPPRSVSEQLLLSTAADRAITNISLEIFRHKRVFVDGTYYDSYDPKYVLGAIRDALSRRGALLAESSTNSDIIVEARCGGLSTDASSSLFGVPATGIPIPLAGVLPVPELALFKSDRQDSIAKLALLAFDTHSREHYYSSGSMVGKSYNHYYKLLFLIQWTSSDIPEKQKEKKHR